MDHRILDDGESFKAWGVGLHYEHDAKTRIIDIINSHTQKAILYVDTTPIDTKKTKNFVNDICKISQFCALNLSQNKTIDICEILQGPHLKSVLKQITRSARRTYYLSESRFSSFNKSMKKTLDTQRLLVRQVKPTPNSLPIFSACYWAPDMKKPHKLTHQNLTNLLHELSQYLSYTVTTQHMLQSHDQSAQQTLYLAQDLLTMSFVLSDYIIPKDFIKHTKEEQNQIVKSFFA